MSKAAREIIEELREAALKGGVVLKDKLHQVADNLDGHFDTIVRSVRDKDNYDGSSPNVEVRTRPFNRNPDHNSDEYRDQLREQMDTLQNTPVSDWLRNRIEYLENGRTSDSLRAQNNARESALMDKIDEYLDQDMSPADARAAAEDWLRTQAALHRLDGIAGGNPTDISRVGDSRVNSSLGSQWRSRVGDIDRAVIDFINNNPGVNLDEVFIDLVFR